MMLLNVRRGLIALLFSAAIISSLPAADAEPADVDIPKFLQEISVTIKCNSATGSGVFKQTKDGTVYVWSCAHLVKYIRREREISTDTGKRIVTEFDDAKVIQYKRVNGRKVAEHVLDAEVIRYSCADFGEDLALLRIRDSEYKPKASAKFHLDKEISKVGSDLLHCGSLLGEVGSNSVTAGIMSQHGRVLNGKVYDQVSCTSFSGSSGGCVVTKKDGIHIGTLVRGAGEGFALIVPARRMQAWAKKVGVEFAMDDSLPVPSEEKLMSYPIEDAVAKGKTGVDSKDTKKYKYLLDEDIKEVAKGSAK